VIGQRLGSYTIESELGSGAMGTVYRAEDAHGTVVAIKVVHPHLLATPGFFKRFLREAEAGRRVEHENVVRTLDADAIAIDGAQHHFLVMEYVEGQTLRSLLAELERVPEELCRHIGREVAKGLAAIHAAGAVHRDLKPENVLITPDHAVKIMDLGVARLIDEAIRLSQTGAFVGTLHYAAPEQLLGEEPAGAADFYSLGLILYELATGRLPFVGEHLAEIVNYRLQKTPRPAAELNPQLSPFFEEVLKALLERDPEERLDFLPEGEHSTWWKGRARAIRAATRQPLRRIRIPRETDLYGRDADLDHLRALFSRAAAGHGQVVLIEGEAGIGKTRLADELVGRLQADGEDLNYLFGGYPPGGAATAASAWSTAYLEHFGADGLQARLREYLSVTPVLVPAFAALLLGEPSAEGSEPLTKDSLQTVFVHVTRALAAERPTVVLIDDLHFAPEEGRALLAALALAVPEHRILLIGTARPGLPETWVANLDRLEHVHRVELDRLGAKDLGRLLIDAFRSERLAQELALKIATKSDGNPFFVFEIIRGLREGQLITRRPDGTWKSTQAIQEITLPSTVRELVQARISALDEEERELLDVAACVGFEFDPLLVGEVLGLPDVPLLRRLGRLEHPHRIVRSAGLRYVFDHHQVQETLYDAQSELLRRRYHAAIAEALERRTDTIDGATAVELCSHFLSGDRGEQALSYLDRALGHLEACYLNEQAVALTDQALAVDGLLTGERRANLLMSVADLFDLLGQRKRQESALAEAVAIAEADGDKQLRARAHRGMAWCHLTQSRHDAAREECELSRDLCREAGYREGEAQATGNLGLIAYSVARYEDARKHLERQLVISIEIGDRLTEAKGTSNLGLVLQNLGRYEEARRHAERHLAISKEIGYRRGEANATGNLGVVFQSLGRQAESRDHYERQIAMTREIGDRRGEATGTGNLGILLKDLGYYAEALEHYERHLAIAREIGDRGGEAVASVNLGVLLTLLGAGDPAREALEASLAISREIGARFPEGYALEGLAEVAEVAGDMAEAERLLGETLALRREIDHRAGIAETQMELGKLLIAVGRHEDARPPLEEALTLGREVRVSGVIVQAAALLAQLPGGDSAAAAFSYEENESGLRHAEKMSALFRLWKATQDGAHLEEAHRLLEILVDRSPEEYRASMLENVPLHRNIEQAWRA
jgi:tetratricopeptide (TPR) repeat protein